MARAQARRRNLPANQIHPKVIAQTAGSAVGAAVVAVAQLVGLDLTPEQGAAIVVIVGAIAGYFKRS